MARQTGLIKIKGTLDNVNFYKTKDGDLARMKTSVDANRIKNDPSFERTRENNEEFGNSANAGKLVRDAVRPMALNASDGKVVSRLTQVMTRIKNMDTTSVRGKRNVGGGILDPNALLMIKGVEFNREALLSAILFKLFTVDTATGEIVITDLIPQMDIVWPQGATHIQLTAGFADIFVVFAQIDGDKFTGFIVERALEGISLGAEEAKMGIKGSSTRQVFFENVKVPVENVLGEIGKGHKIAFNILNIGRIKLAAGVLGGAKVIIDHSIQYANERKQFGVSISSFGAIKHKLAEQAIRTWATEAAMHRASRAIDHEEKRLKDSGKTLAESLLGAAEEYAIECALLKVKGSECLDYVADEGVQIYGGMGYSEEAPMAGAYRDSRINRIFEGTNEINRMLSVDMLMKKAMRGQIDLMSPAMAIQKEMTSMPVFGAGDTGLLGTEFDYVRNMKKCFLAVAGALRYKT